MQPDRPRAAKRPPTEFLWDALFFSLIILLLCLFAAAIFPALGAPRPPPPKVMADLDRLIRQPGITGGATLIVFREGRQLYRIDAGGIGRDAQLPVASASKWMAAALVMTVVDEGKLSLDEPIGKRLPAFTGAAGKITLRQILSYTSGQGSLQGLVDIRQDPRISLADSAEAIAALPLKDTPGKVFRYGSPAFQVAGALAEQATGKSWSQLFEERIGRPLGLQRTFWGNPLWPELSPLEIHNPNLQGGVVTTAEDYGKFLTMLASGGKYDGQRILSENSIREMERAQTFDSRIVFEPAGVKRKMQYALGNWCERVEPDRACSVVSSPGVFGTYPWIDRRHDLYGLLFMRSRRLSEIENEIQSVRGSILQADARSEH
jgi:CubicO group peptidase (beta-lactamase class C family)